MKTKDITYIAISAALIAICSWVSIPFPVPVTLQTLGVFLVVGLIGGKRGFLAVLIYILAGAVGVPVFSGFKGGLAVLFGSTGGYIIGFLFAAGVIWIATHFFGQRTAVLAVSMSIGLIICYITGTLWFMLVILRSAEPMSFAAVIGKSVLPFIIPDIIKIFIALRLIKVLKGRI